MGRLIPFKSRIKPKTLAEIFCPPKTEATMEVDLHVGLGEHVYYHVDSLLIHYGETRLRLEVRDGELFADEEHPPAPES